MSRRREQRLNRLSEVVDREGALHLRDAAGLLGVSVMTVRRDLGAARDRLACLGGYVLPTREAGGAGYRLDRERDSHAQSKAAAGARAARLVEAGDTLFIDCGTTTPHLADRLPPDLPVTVVCYAMNLAEIVCRKPSVTVILLGGLYYRSSASFASDEALAMLRRLGITKAFISAGGVHETHGVSCSNFHEVAIKRAAMGNALAKYLVVDANKFGLVKPARFAALEEFDAVVSDASVEETRRHCAGLRVPPLTT